VLGISAFLPLLQRSAERDFLVVDGISLPLAFLVLAYILRSLRLMLLPVICIGTSIVITFGIMYFVAILVPVVAFTPSLMMSILVAMSFDYSLFLLSRYREDLFSGAEHHKAVEVMLSSAGHTILVSGITLAGTFMGLGILPLVMLRTLGLGSAISIIVTLLVNISLTPALLFIFNKFFPRCVEPFYICGRQFTFGARLEESKMLINDKVHGIKSRSFWYKLSKFTTTFPWNIAIIVVIVGCVVPFALHSTNYKKTDSFDVALPRHYELTDVYNNMVREFGYGTVYPYVLLMEPRKNLSAMSDEFFTTVQDLLAELSQVPKTEASNIVSLPFAMGANISYDAVRKCMDESSIECIYYQYAVQTMVSENRTAMLAYVALSWDPMSQDGFAWLDSAREVLKRNSEKTGATFYFTGVCSDSLDAVRYVYSAFPIMGAVTCGVVLLFVGIAFRSVFIPLRAILTIMLTLAFVFGFATLTYQYDIFKWTHWEGLIAFGSLSWIPPLVCFSIIVGIGLDYDIFLITRIQEFRSQEKYNTTDSIMKGVHKTGGIITAAGVIMAIAFSGLLISSISAMNQLSFYLVFSVLFDTFIVRSLLVPSLMGLFKDVNWWPSKMPEPTKSLWF
jgi:RND superfamily putative drug exporter